MSVLNLPATLRTIGDNAFSDCNCLRSICVSSRNPYFYAEDDVLFERENRTLLCYPSDKRRTEYRIPAGTKGIGPEAFSLSLSGHEDMLQIIHIPESVSSISGSAFNALIGLSAIYVSEENPHFCDADGVLYTKDMTEIVRFPIDYPDSRYSLPDSVKRIGDCAFQSCRWLEDIQLPQGLEEIGAYGFSTCSDLKLRSLPESLVRIGKGAFEGSNRLQQLVLPPNVRQLSSEIAADCPVLSRIVLHHRRDGIEMEEDTFMFFSGEIIYVSDQMQLRLPPPPVMDWYENELYTVMYFLTGRGEDGKHGFYFSRTSPPYKSLLAVWALVHLRIEEEQEKYAEYLQEDDSGIRMLIDKQDYPSLAKVLEYPVITEQNMESLLQYAIDRRDAEITIMLLHYKKQNFGFSDTEDAFSL